MRVCSVEGCGKRHYGRGWCGFHYDRWKRHGDPRADLPKQEHGDAATFFEAAIIYGGDDCLIWPYAKRRGYATIWRDKRQQYASHLICTIVHGSPPPGKRHAAHSCGARACVNPRHIRWASPTENMADKITQSRSGRGERHARAKLTEALVRRIRLAALDQDQGIVAKQFGVTRATISKVVRRKTWYWVD